MAFTKTKILRKEIAKGIVLEQYSFDGASVTTGVVAPDSVDAENYGVIKHIIGYSITDNDTDGGASVIYDSDIKPASLTLTFTSSDTGSVTIYGLVA